MDDQTRRFLQSLTDLGVGASLGGSVVIGVTALYRQAQELEPGFHAEHTVGGAISPETPPVPHAPEIGALPEIVPLVFAAGLSAYAARRRRFRFER
jgi:hypothetical protein